MASTRVAATVLPVPPHQLGLLFSSQLGRDGDPQAFAVELQWTGGLDPTPLHATLKRLVHRHEALRTGFTEAGGIWQQEIHAAAEPSPPLVIDRPDTTADTVLQRLAAQPFDLTRPPLIRCGMVSRTAERHCIVLLLHHLICDRLSVELFVRELAALYRQTRPPAAPAASYRDAVRRQIGRFEGSRDDALAYWSGQLRGSTPRHLLGRPPRLVTDGRAQHLKTHLARGWTTALDATARAGRATLQMVVLTALAAALQRLGNCDDIVIGVPVSSRCDLADDAVFGFFVNTVPLRLQIKLDQPFSRQLAVVRDRLLAGIEHQFVPLGELAATLGRVAHHGGHPLFDAVLAWSEPTSAKPTADGRATLLTPLAHRAAVPLSLLAEERGGELHLTLEFATERFSTDDAAIILSAVTAMLAAARSGNVVPALVAFGSAPAAAGPPADLGAELGILDRFARQVARRPDGIAVATGLGSTSYGDLGQRVIAVAARLHRAGAGPGTRVALLLGRGTDLIAGILAVMRIGATVVVLDPDGPAERLASLIEGAGVTLVVTTAAAARNRSLPPHLFLDRPNADGVAAALPPAAEPGAAYLVFTSGSAGRPKPVAVDHRALQNHVAWAIERFGLSPADRVLQFCSPAFDAAMEEILPALAAGATLVLRSAEAASSLAAFLAFCTEQRITVVDLPTGFWNELARQFAAEPQRWPPHLRLVVIGGEAYDPAATAAWRAALPAGTTVELLNSYGPTEATIVAAAELLQDLHPDRLPTIGRPLPEVTLHVLDHCLQPVPVGVAGELHIGGRGVARGYVGQPAATAAAFLPDPFAAAPGSRLYRTGDRVRRTPSGDIEYLGRADRQVKIRGLRVEPEEIEHVLAGHPAVNAAALVWCRERTAPILVAIVETAGPLDAATLAEYAARRLPRFMLPHRYRLVERLPRTARGKLDREALAVLANGTPAPGPVALSPAEHRLASIWSDDLGLPPAAPDDDFWSLGGHSLLAFRLIALIRERFGVDLPVGSLVAAPTLAAMARHLPADAIAHQPPKATAAAPTPPVRRPLTAAERAIWLDDRLAGDPSPYRIVEAWEVTGPLDPEALRRAFDDVAARIPILRSRIADHGGIPWWEPGPLPTLDIETAEAATAERWLGCWQHDRPGRLDLEHGPPLRLRLIDLGRQLRVLIAEFHHAALDGRGIAAVVDQLAAAYARRLAGQPADRWPLEPPPSPPPADAAWWRRYLDGVPPRLALPVDHPHPPTSSRRANRATAVATVDGAALGRLAAAQSASPFTAALSIVAAWLHRLTRQDDLTVAIAIAQDAGAVGTAGLGTAVLPVRSRLAATATLAEHLRHLVASLAGVLDRRGTTLAAIATALGLAREVGELPLADVLFSFDDGSGEATLRFRGATIRRLAVPVDTVRTRLEIALAARDGRTTVELRGRHDLFEPPTLAAWAASLAGFLAAALTRSDQPLMQVALGTPAPASAAPAAAADICARFRAVVRQQPEAIAIVDGDRQVRYGDLAVAARRVAAELARRGLGTGGRIGVLLPRGADQAAALLGIWQAGAVAVLIDGRQPIGRLQAMLAAAPLDAAIAGTLSADVKSLLDNLPLMTMAALALPDEPLADAADATARPGAAYIAFTSGSTGAPKAVVCSHRGLANLLAWSAEAIALKPEDRLLHMAAPGFDIALWELLHPLLCGARVVVAAQDRDGDTAHLIDLIECHAVTAVHFVPSLLGAFLDALRDGEGSSLRTLVCGGETFPPALFERARRRLGVTIHHTYGPTEAAVFAMHWSGTTVGSGGEPVPLGRPIGQVEVVLVDEAGQPAAAGQLGEICIGGPGVALGYLGRPAETAERFRPDPFAAGPGARLYRTGDLGRQRHDGLFEFHGRIDRQIKIAGVRIEPAEIEAVLGRCPDIATAVVEVVERAGRTDLIAFVVPAGPAAADLAQSVRVWAEAHLPATMVPRQVVVLSELPRTLNGKLDRRALPVPGAAAAVPEHAGAHAGHEALLAAIWRDVLGRTDIRRTDSFFALGGDSIAAIRIAARARAAGLPIALGDIFRHPTIAALAGRLHGGGAAALAPEDLPELAPPSPLQRHRLAAVSQLLDGQLFAAAEPLDPQVLAQALGAVIARHDAFRLRLVEDGSSVAVRTLAPEAAGTVPLLQRADVAGAVDALAKQIDVRRGPLLGAAIVGGDRLLLACHHFAVDWLSWEILAGDLETAYRQAVAGTAIRLPAVPCSHAGWLAALDRAAADPRLVADAAAWRAVLKDAAPLQRAAAGPAETKTVELPSAVAEGLARLAAACDAMPADVVLAAVGQVICRRLGRAAVTVMIENHGRDGGGRLPDLSRTIGWLTAPHPLRITAPASAEPADWVAAVVAGWRQLPAFKPGYGLLRRDGDATLAALPEPSVAFNYLGEAEPITSGRLLQPMAGDLRPLRSPPPSPLSIEASTIAGRLAITVEQQPAAATPGTAGTIAADIGEVLAGFAAAATATAAIPLSPLQEGMLATHLSDPLSGAYHTQVVYRLDGGVDTAILQAAWRRLASRHAVFRTAFAWQDRMAPVMVVAAEATLDWREHRPTTPDEDADSVLARVLAADRDEPFQLDRAPVSRLHHIATADGSRLVWSHHHLLFDGWSLPLITDGLGRAYRAIRDGRMDDEPPGPSFADYVRWWRRQDLAGPLGYWRTALSEIAAPTRLGPPEASAARVPAAIAVRSFSLRDGEAEGLRRLAGHCQVTLHCVVATAWALLLARSTGRRDVVFGMVTALRPPDLPGIEQTVGLCMNTVPLRVRLGRGAALERLLPEVQEALAGAMAHAVAPLSAILAESWPEQRRMPLFDSLLVFENYPGDRHGVTLGGTGRLSVLHSVESTEYRWTLVAMPDGHHLGFELLHRPADAATADGIARQFADLLAALAAATVAGA